MISKLVSFELVNYNYKLQGNRIKIFEVSLMCFYYFFVFILTIFTTHICLVAIKIKKVVSQFSKKHI